MISFADEDLDSAMEPDGPGGSIPQVMVAAPLVVNLDGQVMVVRCPWARDLVFPARHSSAESGLLAAQARRVLAEVSGLPLDMFGGPEDDLPSVLTMRRNYRLDGCQGGEWSQAHEHVEWLYLYTTVAAPFEFASPAGIELVWVPMDDLEDRSLRRAIKTTLARRSRCVVN